MRFSRETAGIGLSFSLLVWVSVPIALATAADVALSNFALARVPAMVYTLIKSTSLVWTAIGSFAIGSVRVSTTLLLTIITVACGAALTALGEGGWMGGDNNNSNGLNDSIEGVSEVDDGGAYALGTLASIVAAVCAALRWVYTERFQSIIESKMGFIPSPWVIIATITPVSLLALAPFAALEYIYAISASNGKPLFSPDDTSVALTAVFGMGILSVTLIFAEVSLVAYTGALSLNILGHAKDALMITLSILILGEVPTSIGIAGAVLTMAGASAYTRVRSTNSSSLNGQSYRRAVDEDGVDTTTTQQHSATSRRVPADIVANSNSGGSGGGYASLFALLRRDVNSGGGGGGGQIQHQQQAIPGRLDANGGFRWEEEEDEDDEEGGNIEGKMNDNDDDAFSWADDDDDDDDNDVANTANNNLRPGNSGVRETRSLINSSTARSPRRSPRRGIVGTPSPRRGGGDVSTSVDIPIVALSTFTSSPSTMAATTTPVGSKSGPGLLGLFSPLFSPVSFYAPTGPGGNIRRGPALPREPKGRGSVHRYVVLGQLIDGMSKRTNSGVRRGKV